jgi:hypothetical protein
MSLVLIDSRLPDIPGIVAGLMAGVDHYVFDYEHATYASLRASLPAGGPYTHVAIAQHNIETVRFPFLFSEPHAVLCADTVPSRSVDVAPPPGEVTSWVVEVADLRNAAGVDVVDPELTSWQAFADFLEWLRVERGTQCVDLLLCNVWSNPNWVYVIERLRVRCGIHIRASLNITGEGGDFVLESDNVDMVGVYFTTGILDYNYAFALTSLQTSASALNPGSNNPLSVTDNGYAYCVGYGKFSRSSDYGATWTFNTTLFSDYGYVAACSADGQHVIIGYNTAGQFKYSNNYGVTFVTHTLPSPYNGSGVGRGVFDPSGTRCVVMGSNNSIMVGTVSAGVMTVSALLTSGVYGSDNFVLSKNGRYLMYAHSNDGLSRYDFFTSTSSVIVASGGYSAFPSPYAAQVNEDLTALYKFSSGGSVFVRVDRYVVGASSVTAVGNTVLNDAKATTSFAAGSNSCRVMAFGGGTGSAAFNRFWYTEDFGNTLVAATTTSTTGIQAIAVSPSGNRMLAASINEVFVYAQPGAGTPPAITGITVGPSAMTVSFTPSTGGVPATTGYQVSLDGGTTFTISPAGTTSPFVLNGVYPGDYNVVLRAYNASGGTVVWSVDSTTPVAVSVPCFLEGTKILRYNAATNRSEYAPIETLKRGDYVKTLHNGYKSIVCIGSRIFDNPPLDVSTHSRLYVYPPQQANTEEEPLVVTGNHCALQYDVPDPLLNKVRQHMGGVYVTEGHYRVPACLDERATAYPKPGAHTIWHFALENECKYSNYGVCANGRWMETSSIRYMQELSGMKLLD